MVPTSDVTNQRAGTSFLAMLVALTFLMNFAARGVPETFAVFLLPVQQGLGVTRSEITLTYSIYMLAYGLSSPLAGQLIDRLGARVSYGFGLACLGAGYLLAGFSTELWHYLVTVGLLGGLGASALGMIIASALLSRWFDQNIGSIISLPYAAIGAGMLVLPPLTQVLLDAYGWRTTHQVLGVGVLLLLPLVVFLPLGRITAGSAAWRQRRASAVGGAGGWTIASALRTSAFWGLFIAYLSTAIAAYSVMPHTVAYLVERGFQPLFAASAFGMAGMLSAIGIIGVGWISDRYGRLRTATLTYVSTLMGIVALLLVSVSPMLLLVYAFVFFFGLMQGARGPIIVAMVAILFPGGVGGVYGMLSIAQGLGAGFGSWVSGVLYQRTGSYTVSFLVAVVGALIGLVTFWSVRSLREETTSLPAPTRLPSA